MSAPRTKLVVAAVTLIMGLVLCEVVLRIVGVGFPVFVKVDPVTGVAHIPGARGWFTSEGRAWVEINGDGLRGPDRPLTRQQGTLRIALLGDSFTEALQVDDEASFARVVERRLSARLGQSVEVLNFGVSGFGTAQEYLLLKNRVWRFAPDVVVLDVLTANDIADNHPALNQAAHMPFFTMREGDLRLDESYLSSDLQTSERGWFTSAWRELGRHSRLVQVMSGAAAAVKSRAGSAATSRISGAEAGLDMDVYQEPSTPVWREAWDLTERLLVAMRDEAHQHGVPLYMIILSNGPQVHPDPRTREQIARDLGVAHLFYPDQRIAAFADRAGIPTLMLAPSLAEEAERTHVFFHGFGRALGTGHWNEDGHRAAGERIAAWLAGRLLPPTM